ncbi:MAG: hypothetical protein BGO98_01840 [Myxococcales bacterium 68-20]|nr:MAG: hypothetical protein BGO98_01840 [Myxococcales bacterium 68-20]
MHLAGLSCAYACVVLSRLRAQSLEPRGARAAESISTITSMRDTSAGAIARARDMLHRASIGEKGVVS